ncbi:MAG: acetyl-CoA carboxylase biotin carboxyl carrier protein [Patescibacteria group bacterium]
MNVKEIRELVRLLAGTDVTELDLETEGMKITIKKGHPVQVAHAGQAFAHQAAPAVPAAAAPVKERAEPAGEEGPVLGPNQVLITAPMVGTFYRAPSPEADPYVQAGEIVEPGQVVCIIEAMKLMNEIESEWKGRIEEILVENAQPVEYGQPLFILEKT